MQEGETHLFDIESGNMSAQLGQRKKLQWCSVHAGVQEALETSCTAAVSTLQ